MRRILRGAGGALGFTLDWAELIFNIALAWACWWATLRLYGHGRMLVESFGEVPTTLGTAWMMALLPDTPVRIWHGAAGSVMLVVACVLGLSAAQGTWWSLRRLAAVLRFTPTA